MERVVSVRRAHGVAFVTLTDERVLKIPSAVYINHRLMPGEPFDESELVRLNALFAYPAALDRAGKLLTEKDYTEGEIARKLRASCYDEAVISRVIEALKGAGYLSDARFAGLYAASRAQKHGKRRIAQELRQKGVDAETLKDALSFLDDESELETATAQAKKLLRRKKLTPELHRKLLAALARRGFSYAIAKKALDAAGLPDAGEDDFSEDD